MSSSITRPIGEQVLIKSARTGDTTLDAYIEAAEFGNNRIDQLLAKVFNTTTGDVRIWTYRNTWQSATVYNQFDIVMDGVTLYVCTQDHTSGGSIDLTKFAVMASLPPAAAGAYPAAAVIGANRYAKTNGTADNWVPKTAAELLTDIGAQPSDSDLTAIAALTTTAFGRGLLTQADAAAARSTLGLGSMATKNNVAIADINATGTPSGSTVLAGDGSWMTVAGSPTGVVNDYIGSTAPTGWILLDGRTIGSAGSGASNRANADTQALYELLWNSMANAQAAVTGGRGASAAADFAANKPIALPDGRGRVIAGKDDMGGTAANRLTNGGAGITATTLGVSGGTETHTLTTAQLASHQHSGGFGGGSNVASNSCPSFGGAATGFAGSGNAHQNTQPTLVLNKIIKL